MPTPQVTGTPAGNTDVLGQKLADVIAADLRNSGLFSPVGRNALRAISFPEVTAPAFDYWAGSGAQALVQGYIRANGEATLPVGCCRYEVSARNEQQRNSFVGPPPC